MTAGGPPVQAISGLPQPTGAFLTALGLELTQMTGTRVTGTITLTAEHHTPWGIVHGGVHAATIESAASIGASHAVRDAGQVAVGLTNTTHFLRPVTAGEVSVEARAVHQGRGQQLWQVKITDDPCRVIA